MRRTIVVTTAWITATVLAVGLAFAGVNAVADRVLDPEPEPLIGTVGAQSTDDPDDDPTEEPSDDSSDDEATTGPSDDPTGVPDDDPSDDPSDDPTSGPDDDPSDDRTSGPDDDPSDDPTDEPSDDPSDEPSDEPSDDPSDEPSEHETEEPDDDPTASPTASDSSAPAETRTYQLIGGTVTIRFSSDRVSVVSATPNDGFELHEIEQPAPTVIDLEFRAHDDSHRSKLDAWWQDGPRERIREEADE